MADPDFALMMKILVELQQGMAELRRAQEDLRLDVEQGFAALGDRIDKVTVRLEILTGRVDDNLAMSKMAIARLGQLVQAADKDNEALRLELQDLKARVIALELRIGVS